MKKLYLYDCFNTILYFNSDSTWNKEMAKEMNCSEKIVSQIRRHAELTVASRNSIGEYTYQDMIHNFYQRYLSLISFNTSRTYDDFYMKCLIEEKKMLSDITKCNYELLNEIKRIKSQGNYVILLSDFYLGKDVVGDLLTNKLGEDAFNLFDEIVVSCDINANKSSGSSYQYILNKYKILPKNCLMTGDNILSDFIMAKKYGLKARLWRKHEKKF